MYSGHQVYHVQHSISGILLQFNEHTVLTELHKDESIATNNTNMRGFVHVVDAVPSSLKVELVGLIVKCGAWHRTTFKCTVVSGTL